jgi:hypothetical protein
LAKETTMGNQYSHPTIAYPQLYRTAGQRYLKTMWRKQRNGNGKPIPKKRRRSK